MVEQRISRQALEKRCRTLTYEVEEAKGRLKEVQAVKTSMAREFEVVRRERNFLSESLKELKRMIVNE